MKQIKYSYCIDDNNELVHIKSLTNLTRHSRKLYCLQCGREMVANLGTKKTWHFSHKSECACDGESYLHKLAKRRIKERFDKVNSFPINFTRSVPCIEHKECPFYMGFYCEKEDVKIASDLKFFNNNIVYDLCMEENSVGEFRPDLLLKCSSKPEREPVFIEIFKTHKSNEKKISSSNRIIETIKIDSEDVIDDIIERGFVEGENCKTYNFNPQLPSSRQKNSIGRFVLFHSNSAIFYSALDYMVYCDKKEKKIHPKSFIELNIKDLGIYGQENTNVQMNTLNPYQKGLVYLVHKGIQIRNCILCKFYRYNDYHERYICILYKTIGLHDPHPKQTMANECQRYEINQELLKCPLSELKKEVFELL